MRFLPKKTVAQIYINIPGLGQFHMEERTGQVDKGLRSYLTVVREQVLKFLGDDIRKEQAKARGNANSH